MKPIKTKRTLNKKLKGRKIVSVDFLSENCFCIKLNDGKIFNVGADSVYIGQGSSLPIMRMYVYSDLKGRLDK
jgi:hypothetical protein